MGGAHPVPGPHSLWSRSMGTVIAQISDPHIPAAGADWLTADDHGHEDQFPEHEERKREVRDNLRHRRDSATG